MVGATADLAGEAPAAARAADDAEAEASDGAEPPLLLVTTVAISAELSDRIELRLGDCPLARLQAAPPPPGRSATAPGLHGLSWEPMWACSPSRSAAPTAPLAAACSITRLQGAAKERAQQPGSVCRSTRIGLA